MISWPSVLNVMVIRPNITLFEVGDCWEGHSLRNRPCFLGRNREFSETFWRLVTLIHCAEAKLRCGRRCSTEGASDERSKDSWFTDVASRYDRVEASIREATY